MMLHDQQELIKLTKHELLKMATDLDVKYRTRMAKPQLVSSILDVLKVKRRDVDPDREQVFVEQTGHMEDAREMDRQKETAEASKYGSTTVVDQEEHPPVAQIEEEQVKSHVDETPAPRIMDDGHDIPWNYQDNLITLMVVDPEHIHAYWDHTDERRQNLLQSSGRIGQPYETVVRLYDVTDINFNGTNAWSMNEFNVGMAMNWYFNVTDNRSYCAEIGLKFSDQEFLLIARSNTICTPRNSVSDFYDEEWMMIDFNRNKDLYNELYRLSGGHLIRQYQLNSAFITEKGEESVSISMPQLNLSSEFMGSEYVQQKVEQEKDFWLWVDTELIVYGQTKSDATVTINDEQIQLDSDGRFRLHMALPDGHFPFHVKGVSSDGSMQRSVTPVVDKETQ